MINISIPNALGERLAFLAGKAHVPQDEYVIDALAEILEDREDYLEAIEVLENVKKNKEKLIPWEEVQRQYEDAHPFH